MLVLCAFMLLLSACGGSGSGADPAAARTGRFIDDPVEGLQYETATQKAGITNSQGEFAYRTGETVHFFIGHVDFGSVRGAAVITPQSLVAGAQDSSNRQVTNIARTLLTLDADCDPSNGIQISAAARTAGAGHSTLNFDQSEADYGNDAVAMSFINQAKGSCTALVSGQSARTGLARSSDDTQAHGGRPNYLPVLQDIVDISVAAGEQVSLSAVASDPDHDALSYAWTRVSGPVVQMTGSDTRTVSFSAPAAGPLTLRLTVTDARGGTAHDEVTVNTPRPSENSAPVARAGNDQTVNEGATVTLDGHDSSDPEDGNNVTYQWTQTTGPVVALSSASEAGPHFVAPAVDVATALVFRLKVSDRQGLFSEDEVTVTVNNVQTGNTPPVANAGPDRVAAEGTVITLNGSGSDADGTIAAYHWSQVSGPTGSFDDAGMAVTHFTAPAVTADQTVVLRLTVTDDAGDSAADEVSITVQNVPPVPLGCVVGKLCVGASKRAIAPSAAQVAGVMEPRYPGTEVLQRFHLGGFGFGAFEASKLVSSYSQGMFDERTCDPTGATGTCVSDPAASRPYYCRDGKATCAEALREYVWVRAFYLRQPAATPAADKHILFLTLDATGAGNLIIGGIKKAVSAATGVPQDNILVGMTHSHAAPDLQGLWGGVPQEWITGTLYKQAVAAASEAKAIAQPATLTYAKGQDAAFNSYRRPRLDKQADADPNLSMLQAKGDDGRVLGTLVQYSAHPTGVGTRSGGALGRAVHPDFPLGLEETIEAATGGAPALYYNGPIADASGSGPVTGSNDYERVYSRGACLARSMLALVDAQVQICAGSELKRSSISSVTLDPSLTVAHATVTMPITNPLFLSVALIGSFNRYYDFAQLPTADIPGIGPMLAEAQPNLPQVAPVASTLVSRVTIGGTGSGLELVTIPGEATNTFGQYIRGLTGNKNMMLLGLTQNSFGYIIPEEEFSYIDPSGSTGFLVPFTGYEEFVSMGPLTAPLLRLQGYNPLFGLAQTDPRNLPPTVTACQTDPAGRACLLSRLISYGDYIQHAYAQTCRESGGPEAFCSQIDPELAQASACYANQFLPTSLCDLIGVQTAPGTGGGSIEGSWLKGDLHVHDDHSADGSLPRQTIGQGAPGNVSVGDQILFAETAGLDFLPLNDHRTFDQHYDPLWRSSKLLLITGEEANSSPHATVFGAVDMINQADNPAAVPEFRKLQQSIWDAHLQGASWSTAHPDDGEINKADGKPNSFAFATGANLVEAWNRGTLNRAKISYCEDRWNAGYRFGIAGASDDHFKEIWPISGPGEPTTRVFASRKSTPGLLEALRAGRTVVNLNVAAPVVTLSGDFNGDHVFEAIGGDEARLAPGAHATLRVSIQNGMGATVSVYRMPGKSAGAFKTFQPTQPDQNFDFDIVSADNKPQDWYRVEVRGPGEPDSVDYNKFLKGDVQGTFDPDYANQLRALTSPIFVSTGELARPLSPELPADRGEADGASAIFGQASDNAFAGFAGVAVANGVVHAVAEVRSNGSSSVQYSRRAGGVQSAPVSLAPSSLLAFHPRIVASGDDVWVVWQDGRAGEIPHNPQIYVRHSTDGGLHWLAEQQVSSSTGRAEHPDIALISATQPVVVWQDNGGGAVDIYARVIGGDSAPINLSAAGKTVTAGSPQDSRSAIYPASVSPRVAVNASGMIAVAWQDNRHDVDPGWTGHATQDPTQEEGTETDDWEVLVATRATPAATWAAAQNVSKSPQLADRHASVAFAPSGSLYVAWDSKTIAAAAGPRLALHISHANAAGSGWTPVSTVAQVAEYSSQRPVFGRNGGLLSLFWMDGRASDWRWRVMRSDLGSDGTWISPQTVTGRGNSAWPAYADGWLVFTSDRSASREQRKPQQVFLRQLDETPILSGDDNGAGSSSGASATPGTDTRGGVMGLLNQFASDVMDALAQLLKQELMGVFSSLQTALSHLLHNGLDLAFGDLLGAVNAGGAQAVNDPAGADSWLTSLTRLFTGSSITSTGTRAGVGVVDMTPDVGYGTGQHGGDGPVNLDAITGVDPANAVDPGDLSGPTDPYLTHKKQALSYGVQSRLTARAIVVEGANGKRIALLKTDNYLAQDSLLRRVAQILDQGSSGIGYEQILYHVTHDHSAAYSSTPSAGMTAFQDAFDPRFFENQARKMAQAIELAAANMKPARMGAIEVQHKVFKGNVVGRQTADDGTPAGYPDEYGDHGLVVMRFDEINARGDFVKPLAVWVNWGEHPESLQGGVGLHSADFLGPLERFVERDIGAPLVFSQGDVGSSEKSGNTTHRLGDDGRQCKDQSAPDATCQAGGVARDWNRRHFTQMERNVRYLADDIKRGWHAIADIPADSAESRKVQFSNRFEVNYLNAWVPGPLSHPYPSISNCRADTSVKGNVGVPVAGLPDCQRLDAPGSNPLNDQAAMIYATMKAEGVPVPEQYDAPSFGALEENARLKLQAFQLGDVLLASCACEAQVDLILNLESRLDMTPGKVYDGFDWACLLPSHADEAVCRDQKAFYDPVTYPTAIPGSTGNPALIAHMRAQVHNPADGWDAPEYVPYANSEPAAPASIKGNFTRQEIQNLGASGFRLPVGVGHAGDYNGYTVSYREYMRGDHYRKALTAYGPHTADYMVTRLVRMAAELHGGQKFTPEIHDAVAQADEVRMRVQSTAFGQMTAKAYAGWQAALPPDIGPAAIIAQPRQSLPLFSAATFRWRGGSTQVDNPVARVEKRCTQADIDSTAQDLSSLWLKQSCSQAGVDKWVTFADMSGEVQTRVHFPEGPQGVASVYTGQFAWEWTANFEAYLAFPARLGSTPAGTYQFAVRGCINDLQEDPAGNVQRRGTQLLATDVCPGGSRRYELTSSAFVVTTGTPRRSYVGDPGAFPFIKDSTSSNNGTLFCDQCSFRPWARPGGVQ